MHRKFNIFRNTHLHNALKLSYFLGSIQYRAIRNLANNRFSGKFPLLRVIRAILLLLLLRLSLWCSMCARHRENRRAEACRKWGIRRKREGEQGVAEKSKHNVDVACYWSKRAPLQRYTLRTIPTCFHFYVFPHQHKATHKSSFLAYI